MAKVQFQPVPQTIVAVEEFQPHALKALLAGFPVVALGVLFVQPALISSAVMSIAFAVCLIVAALVGTSANQRQYKLGRVVMGLVAPVQFALMIWVSVYAGHMIAGEALIASTFAAFAVFAMLLLVDFVASVGVLLLAARGSAVCGLSAANLIAGKYAGLLGQIR